MSEIEYFLSIELRPHQRIFPYLGNTHHDICYAELEQSAMFKKVVLTGLTSEKKMLLSLSWENVEKNVQKSVTNHHSQRTMGAYNFTRSLVL